MELSDKPDDDKDNELYIVKLEYELDRVRQTHQLTESIWNDKEETLNSIIAEQKQVISLLESLLKSNQQYYEDLQKSSLRKEDAFKSVNEEIEKTLSHTSLQIDSLSRNVEKAELALEDKNVEIAEKNAQIEKYESQLSDLKSNYVRIQSELAQVNDQQEKISSSYREAERLFAETRKQRDGFKRARDHLQQTNDVLVQTAKKAEAQSAKRELELQQKVSETVRLYETGRQAREELQRTVDQQSQDLQRLKSERVRQLEEIEGYRHLSEESERLQREVEELSRNLARLHKENTDMQNASVAQNQSHQLALSQLEEKYDSIIRANEDTSQARLKELESKLTFELSKRAELEKKFERASINLTGLFAREQRYKQNISALEDRIVSEREKAYQTISYQVGYAFMQAGKSVKGFFRLPAQLFRIRKQSRLKKTQLEDKKKIIRLEAPLPTAISVQADNSVKKVAGNVKETPKDGKLRIAAIMDEFTFHSYSPEADVLQLHPESWKEQLQDFKAEILFIESAWNGLDGLWKSKISNADPSIIEIIEWCRANNVPTLFWNKEDPVHFSTFLPIASRVDVVFTTDVDCLARYKKSIGHDRVYLLPFAAQPLTHNPIEKYERKDAFNFAGSYYLRYPERQRDFASLIDTVKQIRPLEIYDRNFENPHPHYLFPEKYRDYIIGSLPFEQIDKAYKGYRYGINMNTIKQSQTMFARRVFELLASNTVVVSNFSRGVRLMFGDLVVSSDNSHEISERLRRVCGDELEYRKLRLLGLRKVMKEHTYASRLQYISEKVLGRPLAGQCPEVILVAQAKNENQFDKFLNDIARQTYKNIRGIVLASKNIHTDQPNVIAVHGLEDLEKQFALFPRDSFVSFISNEDYYGPNYVLDLVLAERYSAADAFGKPAHYQWKKDNISLIADGTQYSKADDMAARSSIIRTSSLTSEAFSQAAQSIDDYVFKLPDMLGLDEFGYCKNGETGDAEVVARRVGDSALSNQGMSLEKDISNVASHITLPDNPPQTNLPQITAAAIAQRIPKSQDPLVQWNMKRGAFHIVSKLTAEKFVYIYSRQIYTRAEMNMVLNSQFKLECEATCQLKSVFEFQDADGKKIAHSMSAAGDFNSLAIPEHCTQIRFGLRVQGPGEASITRLILGNYGQKPAAIISSSPYLVLTKQYPDYDDLYKYGFLHTRLRAYKAAGLNVDVFRITKEDGNIYREFEDVDIVSGDANLLDATLSTGQYRNVLVHLLDEKMWSVLRKYLDRVHVTVWVHGAEIQVWQRRQFEFERMGAEEVKRQKRLSDKRLKFWQSILKDPHPNLKLVFVSEYFAKEVAEDFSIDLRKVNYDIVHNFIDGELFPYRQKSPDQRRKLLSIRPYASRKYANDLTVKAILELSKRDFFSDLEIALYGDGELFEEITNPLKDFPNVKLHRRFLSHREISELHKEYGVFLSPTRMDSQGVSRDEAMSSGLVPVTTRVTAIPEFVDADCGMLVEGEDYIAMADAVEKLYRTPGEFIRLSKNASDRVRCQSGLEATIMKEVKIITRADIR